MYEPPDVLEETYSSDLFINFNSPAGDHMRLGATITLSIGVGLKNARSFKKAAASVDKDSLLLLRASLSESENAMICRYTMDVGRFRQLSADERKRTKAQKRKKYRKVRNCLESKARQNDD